MFFIFDELINKDGKLELHVIEWLIILKWFDILWLCNNHLNCDFFLGGGEGFASSKLSLVYLINLIEKKINMHSIIIGKQTKHHINVISTILHLFLFQKVQFF